MVSAKYPQHSMWVRALCCWCTAVFVDAIGVVVEWLQESAALWPWIAQPACWGALHSHVSAGSVGW